jgi:hypothetical protein
MADLNVHTGVGRKENKGEWYKYGMTATIRHLGGVATGDTWHFCPVAINDRCAINKFTNTEGSHVRTLLS